MCNLLYHPQFTQSLYSSQKVLVSIGICILAPLSACGWLIPLRPHVLGDALTDFLTVVKPRLAHTLGLSARQPVTTRDNKKEIKKEKGIRRRDYNSRGVGIRVRFRGEIKRKHRGLFFWHANFSLFKPPHPFWINPDPSCVCVYIKRFCVWEYPTKERQRKRQSSGNSSLQNHSRYMAFCVPPPVSRCGQAGLSCTSYS